MYASKKVMQTIQYTHKDSSSGSCLPSHPFRALRLRRMRAKRALVSAVTRWIIFVTCAFILLRFPYSFAEETLPFSGEVNSNNINVRIDSTVTSEVICNVSKGARVDVISEQYGWYKIRLPKNAPAFIKKNFVSAIEEKSADSFARIAKVSSDRVNIRLHPNESSAILGRATQNEIITILADSGSWYKIETINNSFGWINKKFVDKSTIAVKAQEPKQAVQVTPIDNSVTVEGTIRPYGMIIKRIATHKLITNDNNIFLLKGNKKSLDALNYHKVRVMGKFINANREKFPVIEIEKLEGLQ